MDEVGHYNNWREKIMAKKKKKRSRKQGLVSLALNGTALCIALAPAAMRAKDSLFTGDWQGFADGVLKDYTGIDIGPTGENGATISWDPMAAKGLFALGGAVIFKKGTGMLMKHVKIKL
jgi:hypothetical protein